MANEIKCTYESGHTLYALIFNAAGQVWDQTNDGGNGSFEAYAAASIDNYDVPLLEIATASGQYRGTFDSHVSAGVYSVVLYYQPGASPAITDSQLGHASTMYWDGTAEITQSTIDTVVDSILEDTGTTLPNQIVAASPQAHSSDSSTDTTGTIDAGTYAATATLGGAPQYWQISPVTPAVGGFGLNVYLEFDIGTGLDRVPSSLNITGYFDAIPVRDVHIWAYNFLTTTWDQLSDGGSAMDGAETANKNYQFTLTRSHVQTTDGKVRIRFTATSITAADNLYLDFVAVNSVAVEAAGLTAEAIAVAVHRHDVSIHTDHNSAGFRISVNVIGEYAITSSDTASSFTCSSLIGIGTNYYQYHRIRIHDITGDRYADSWIASMDNSGVIILGRALPFTPDTSAELYVMENIITPVQIQTQIEGGGSTLETIAVDVAGLDGAAMVGTNGANTTVPDAAGTAATLHGTTDGKIDVIDANVDQIETAVITNAAGVDIAADIIALKAETASILDDTDLIDDGTNGLAAIKAEVEGIGGITPNAVVPDVAGTAQAAITAAHVATDADISDAYDRIGDVETLQTTTLARIGAFTGTGVNTVLGFLKAVCSKVATLPSDIGGTFAATTDSLEAISEGVNTIGGTGATEETYTVTDSVSGLPLDGVTVWVTTDEAGANVIASGATDASGEYSFYHDLATGTAIYMWRQHAGYNFSNPDEEAAS